MIKAAFFSVPFLLATFFQMEAHAQTCTDENVINHSVNDEPDWSISPNSIAYCYINSGVTQKTYKSDKDGNPVFLHDFISEKSSGFFVSGVTTFNSKLFYKLDQSCANDHDDVFVFAKRMKCVLRD